MHEREKNAKRNIYVSLICQAITMICGLITPRFLLLAFGSEMNGAASSITTFLGYIAILEGGIGGVARAALYKPLAENDTQRLNLIMSEIKRFFRGVGFAFCFYTLILACSFRYISQTNILDWATSFFLVIVISISTFSQYFIGISYSVLIIASQKQYINYLINILGTICNCVAVILLTQMHCSFIAVKLVSSVVFSIRPVILWLYVKKHFTLQPAHEKGNVLKDKWTGLGQHIAYFLHTHTDVVVLTLFGNLKAVSVYAVYSMITSAMQNIVCSFSSGMEAVFGDMYAKNQLDTLNKTFDLYESLISIISTILFSTTAVLILPFVKLYTAGINDANYLQPAFGVLLVVACIVYCLRAPYHNMVIAAGHFRQTNLASYGEAAINIVSSVILVIRFGLVGVAAGTVIATSFRFIYYALYLSKNIIKRSLIKCVKRQLINMLSIMLVCFLGIIVISKLDMDSFVQWIFGGTVIGIISCAVTLITNIIWYKKDVISILRKLRI